MTFEELEEQLEEIRERVCFYPINKSVIELYTKSVEDLALAKHALKSLIDRISNEGIK